MFRREDQFTFIYFVEQFGFSFIYKPFGNYSTIAFHSRIQDATNILTFRSSSVQIVWIIVGIFLAHLILPRIDCNTQIDII